MKPAAPTPLDPAIKKWLAGLAIVAVLFLLTTIYSVVHTLQVTREDTRDRSQVQSFAGDTSPPAPEEPEAPSISGRIKLLDLPVAPTPPKTPEGIFIYKTPEQIERDIVHAQAEAQREFARKYPKSSSALTPDQIDEMEAKGITLN